MSMLEHMTASATPTRRHHIYAIIAVAILASLAGLLVAHQAVSGG